MADKDNHLYIEQHMNVFQLNQGIAQNDIHRRLSILTEMEI